MTHGGACVPPAACVVECLHHAQTRPFAVGTPLVFDDSFVHEAWNRAATPRLVLIFDVWHPDLSDSEVGGAGGNAAYRARGHDPRRRR